MISPNWNRPPIAQAAAVAAPSNSVPTRMATLSRVSALRQLMGGWAGNRVSAAERGTIPSPDERQARRLDGGRLLWPSKAMTDTPTFARAAVAAPHRLAAEAGRAILAEGGNAIEAMIAMAAAIAVVYPHMNGIGGDGFWLIAENPERVRAIEGCGFAGRNATIEHYRALGGIPSRGPQAALAVPGAIGGWSLALDLSASRGGKLPLSVLLDPAIRLAREGYAVSPCEARTRPIGFDDLKQAPGFAAAYLVDGESPAAGALRRALRLAETLAYLAHAGLDDFYRGDVGREIAADLQRIGAPIAPIGASRCRCAWTGRRFSTRPRRRKGSRR